VTYNGSYGRCAKDEEAVEEMTEENTGAETEPGMEKMKKWSRNCKTEITYGKGSIYLHRIKRVVD